jgi:PAS domain S-box-containing protein
MSIKTKLTILFITFTLISLALFGTLVFFRSGDILKSVRMAQLNSIADLKKNKIETFFSERLGDLRSIEGIQVLARNLPLLSVHRNSRGVPSYLRAKAEVDERMDPFREAYAYSDIMLVNSEGTVVYELNSENSGIHLNKQLEDNKAFAEGRKWPYFTDIFRDAARGGRPVMWGIAPIRDRNGLFIGEIVLEIDMEPIFSFIQDNTGIGKTGEALIVRRESDVVLFMSPLRAFPDSALQKTVPFDAKMGLAAQKAANGETGSGFAKDYKGTEVLAAWRYLPSLRWGLVTKIDAVEAFEPVRQLEFAIVVVGALLIFAGALAAAAIASSLARPIQALQRGTEIIGGGNFDYKVGTHAKDEVGQLSRLIDSMTENLKKITASRDDLDREIAERRRAEEALRLANAYNRSLLEASLDPLVTIAADGKITDVNVATEKATGWARNELIGTDFSDYFTDPRKARAGYQQVFREGSVMDYALEIRRRDGHLMPVLYNAAVYRDESGNVTGVFAAARDITERKKAEEEINKLNRELEARVVERTAELENSNKELEAFAYSVSHDLRSPLRSIEGFSLALLEDYSDMLDDTGKGYLNRVRNATIKMGQLIDDLLKLSRVTRSEMNRERINLSSMVKTIARNLGKQHPERPAEFIVADGLTAFGDERLLSVALENLFANAWKFSENSSRIVIEFGTIEKNEGRAFFVKDNGVGFDMTYASKLFNPFQRLHRMEEFPGTGIGLATVKRIVTRHGGRVWIESEINKGTTVYFTLG